MALQFPLTVGVLSMASLPPKRMKMEQDTDFFYFGASFYYSRKQVDCSPWSITLSEFAESDAAFRLLIKREVKKLNECELGGKNRYEAGGQFTKLMIERNVYVYRHRGDHATCSQTKFSQIGQLVRNISVQTLTKDEPDCTRFLDHHYCLLPYYYNNPKVLKKYKDLHAQTDQADIQTEIERLEKIVESKEDDTDTPYQAATLHTNEWSEDVWSYRLHHGIQKLFPQTKVTYTATMRLTWNTDLLKLLGVADFAGQNHYLFRGAPDVLIGKKHLISVHSSSGGSSSEDGDSDNNSLVKNNLQTSPMKPFLPGGPPEKVGKVFAGLYILLVSKILRTVQKGKNVCKEYKVEGLLLDKLNGGIHCILSVELKGGESELKFNVLNYCGIGLMADSNLCGLLHSMLK